MSIYPVICDHIALPSSQIKSPGSRLRDTDRGITYESTQQKVQRLLEEFKSLLETETNKLFNDLRLLRTQASGYHSLSSSSASSSRYSELRSVIKHLEAKSSTDEIEFLVKKALQILAFYDIEFLVETSGKHTSEMYNLLKYLIPELCLFPEAFVKRLQIKQFVICISEELAFFETIYTPGSTIFFTIDVDPVEMHSVVSEGIYTTILNNMNEAKPNLFKEWVIAISSHNSSPISCTYQDFEMTFFCLMRNTNVDLLKAREEKLKEVLRRNFPDELTSGWFQARSKEKKKSGKVRFGDSTITLI